MGVLNKSLKGRAWQDAVKVRTEAGDENVLWFTISTERQASDGGVLIADGMSRQHYDPRPFVLLMHDVRDAVGSCVDMRRSLTGWDAAVRRSPDDAMSPEALRWWNFCRYWGYGAASIRFDLTEVDWDPQAEELAKYNASGRGWIGRKWDLLEWSLVSLQADPGALMLSLDGSEAADPFATIKDKHERAALKRTFSLVGMRSAAMRFAADKVEVGSRSTEPKRADEPAPETPAEPTVADLVKKIEELTTACAGLANRLTELEAQVTEMAADGGDVEEMGDEETPVEGDDVSHSREILEEIAKAQREAKSAFAPAS